MKRALTERARQLRRSGTLAEQELWRELRNRQCAGYQFCFQHPVPPFVADFVCLERRLIVELDGGQHTAEQDAPRTAYLEARGYQVPRFWNNDVLEHLDGVYQGIERAFGGTMPLP